jgi:hypothetical protein
VSGNIEIYQSIEGETSIEATFDNDTVWLTQAQIAVLFETPPQNITMHLKSVFNDKELFESSTCKNFLQVRKDGKEYTTKFYDLDVIISVGYNL